MLRDIILWGATGQAVVIDEFLQERDFNVIALLDRDTSRSSPLPGVPIFAGPNALTEWEAMRPAGDVWALVAIGGAHGRERCAVQAQLVTAGLNATTLVHPSAWVAASARLDAGTVVLAQAAVGARAKLGCCVIINTSASVDHECVLGAGVHIGPGARLAGCVRVGAGAFIATGAIVGPRVQIGEDSIVGAGSVVLEDLPPGVIAYGNPVRVVRAVGSI